MYVGVINMFLCRVSTTLRHGMVPVPYSVLSLVLSLLPVQGDTITSGGDTVSYIYKYTHRPICVYIYICICMMYVYVCKYVSMFLYLPWTPTQPSDHFPCLVGATAGEAGPLKLVAEGLRVLRQQKNRRNPQVWKDSWTIWIFDHFLHKNGIVLNWRVCHGS